MRCNASGRWLYGRLFYGLALVLGSGSCVSLWAAALPEASERAQPVLPDLTKVHEFQPQPVSWWPHVINAGWGGGRGGPERLKGWTAENWLLLDYLDRAADFTSNDWLTHRGIWHEVYGYNEYQETIHFHLEGARKLLWENGIARDFNNEPVLSPDYNNSVPWWKEQIGWDAYIVCNNAPRWSAIIDYDLLSAAVLGHATSQDNIGGPTSRIGAGSHGRYCDYCNRKFFDYLRRTQRLPDFRRQYTHIRDYVRNTQRELIRQLPPFAQWTWDPPQAELIAQLCAPPVMNEYQKFLYLSHLSNWSTYYKDCKLVAGRLGRDFDVHGNQGGSAIGPTPYQVALADFVDIVWFESQGISAYDMFKYHWNNADGALRYVMGRAMTRGRKPFMSMLKFHKLTPDIVEHELAECCAGGGVLFPFQDSLEEAPVLRQLMTEYFRFRHAHRALFQPQNSVPYSEVGIIYSIPSFMYHDYMYSVSQPLCAFEGIVRACQEGHIQYDVIIMNHPEFYRDHWGLEELRAYRIIIVPAAECLTDAQIMLLTQYLKEGGTLAVTGACGTKDENNLPRANPPLERWKKAGRVIEIRPGKTYLPPRTKEGPATQAQTAETLQALWEALRSTQIIQGELPRLLWAKAWRHSLGASVSAGETLAGPFPILSVHFVNYDVDFETGKATDTASVPVTIRLPEGIQAEEAQWLVPGREPQTVALELAGRQARLMLPPVQIYGILVIGPRGEEAEASARLQLAALNARAQLSLGRSFSPAPDIRRAEEQLRKAATIGEERYLTRLQEAVELNKPVYAFAFGAPQDFGEWKAIQPDTAYTQERGYGWLPHTDDSEPMPEEIYYALAEKYGRKFVGPEPVAARLPFWPYRQPVPLPLQWSLSSGTPCRFRVDVPPGRYRVRVVNVNPSWTNLNFRVSGMISCQGRVMLPDVPLEKSSLVAREFVADSPQGELTFTFGGPTGWGIAALMIEPAPRSDASAAPAGLPLREWLVSPRYPNPEWWRDVSTSVEKQLNRLPLSGWTRLQANCAPQLILGAGLPVIDLGSNRQANIGDVVYAVTTIRGPLRPGARLHFGATSQATLWLNGRRLGFVPNEKGLREEFVAPLSLPAGEHKLVVKLQRFWERHWLFMAMLKWD